ncbi:hypothetical protein PLESTB_000164900 [Pleodorina starrii]|uniref:Uncharacterized protein n=1 Tax=Pleodorina starrii TaxID=330485 RepID=A0A9W6BC45_9CHLO|nr:hypothetical protein PLESTM_000463200 [Pleodorina starrii]GLC48937.1 hypothetical protein PLESTB_000164900 [Pleodorina starrii]GLC72666.1 hypothetical protein PLESTF_001276300 [Pleodorina starrii]
MAIGALRVPLRIAESYVRPGEEQLLFPKVSEFLTRDEVLSVWPRGLITHEKFSFKGSFWRLAKRPMPNGNSVYMAVLDDSSANGNGATTYGTPSSCATPDAAQRLRSVPIDTFSGHETYDVVGAAEDTPARQHRGAYHHSHLHHAPTAPPPLNSHSSSQRELALTAGNSLRERNGSYSSMALVAAPPSGAMSLPMVSGSFSLAGGGNGFMTDLLAATESPMPLDRYKAFVRLFSGLSRLREAMGLPHTTPRAAAEDVADPAWEGPEAQDLVRQMLMVGECLAKFGTAEFVDGRNNSSRAITTKDYAKLLRMYLEGQGAVFRDDFIGRLPLSLQDEALTVRTLLQTRCETNDMLFNQLVKHVGQEPTAGGAMVFNNSSVSANPTNHMLAAPKTFVNTVSNAWSKADSKRRTQLGALGAVAVVALWVLKRKLFGGGGGGRGRGRRDGRDESEWGGSGGRRSSRIRGSGDLATRLLDERSSAERMAVRYLSACHDELRRASQNDHLLRNDWRLGPLRLALPGTGSVPEGYEPVQTTYCSVASYMNALDGGAPFALPYGITERTAPPLRDLPSPVASSAAAE